MSFYSIDSELICDLWVQTLDQTQSLCQGIFFLRGGWWLGFYSWETEAQRSVNFSTKQNQLHRSKLKRHWSLKGGPGVCVGAWMTDSSNYEGQLVWTWRRTFEKHALVFLSLSAGCLFPCKELHSFLLTHTSSPSSTHPTIRPKKKKKRSEIKFFSFLQVPDCCHFPRDKAVGEFEEIRAPHRGKSH